MAAPRLLDDFEENAARRRARINRPRWEPKAWHPVYEEIVLLDALGYKNTEIAEMKGFTVVHISNVLRTQQAKTLKEILVARLRTKGAETFEQRIERYAHKALDRIDEVMHNDEYAAKNPGGIFDRAITLLKVSGKVKDPEEEKKTPPMMVPIEVAQILRDGIAFANKARLLNPAEDVSGEIISEPAP